MFVPSNKKNICSNNSIDTHHEPTNKLWDASLKKCSETATVNKTGFMVMALNIFSLMPHLDELRVLLVIKNHISLASLRQKLIAQSKIVTWKLMTILLKGMTEINMVEV